MPSTRKTSAVNDVVARVRVTSAEKLDTFLAIAGAQDVDLNRDVRRYVSPAEN